MALTSDEVSSNTKDEVDLSFSAMENEEIEQLDLSSMTRDEEQTSSTSLIPIESEEEQASLEESTIVSSDQMHTTNLINKRRDQLKTRSVSFAPTVEEIEIPSRHCSSYHQPIDFIDALVESYQLEISTNSYPLREEKKYVPKTIRTRLNPNWREHRIRHLMNKLEELSLWDREEELKVSQAQFLREQKLEQIQDRQRNHDLCLNLMRQRHESEMESAVLLDRIGNDINDENIQVTIAEAMNLASPANVLAFNLPTLRHTLKRRAHQAKDKQTTFKTPIGRYRQFESNMNNKLDQINQKLQPDWEIMRAYSPYRTSIPATVVPLFNETYAALLAVPDTYSSNKYNQYHYGVAPYLHQTTQHASSPDYETRSRSHSNRDVRVPLKEQASDNNRDIEDDHSRSRLSPRRSGNSVSSTASSLYDCSTLGNASRDYSFIHSRQPMSNSIHQRTLNDDLNAITQRSLSPNFNEVYENGRSRSSSSKRVTFIDPDENEENVDYYSSTRKMIHEPTIISLSSTR